MTWVEHGQEKKDEKEELQVSRLKSSIHIGKKRHPPGRLQCNRPDTVAPPNIMHLERFFFINICSSHSGISLFDKDINIGGMHHRNFFIFLSSIYLFHCNPLPSQHCDTPPQRSDASSQHLDAPSQHPDAPLYKTRKR